MSRHQPTLFFIIIILISVSIFRNALSAETIYHFSAKNEALLTRLASDVKLMDAAVLLTDFEEGKPEAEVIVTLKPTAVAETLAVESQISSKIPQNFNPLEVPTYYDLQNLDIKSRLRETVTVQVDQVIAQLNVSGVTVTQRFSYQFGFAARVTPDALTTIINHPSVLRVEKNWELKAHLSQGLALINANLPRLSYDGSGLSIAICDTGIDTAHPGLGGGGQPIFNAKVIGGYDTGDKDADPRPNSLSGDAHGTACAGIAAGNLGAAGDYVGGVAPGAKLYAIKISSGNTGMASSASMIAGWEWAITHQNDDPANPIRIISTSFGGGFYSGQSACDSAAPAMTTAAVNAVAAGITLFASAGNDGNCNGIGWPACISYVNSVGAVYDANIGQIGFCVAASSCAAKQLDPRCPSDTPYMARQDTAADRVTVYSNSSSFLTLFAPSHNAYTTDIVGPGGDSPGDYDENFGGTSAACPYAAGAAAVLQSAAKAKTGAFLTPAQVRQYLTANGDAVTDGKAAVTKPRINLARAVDALAPSDGSDYLLTANTTGVGSGTVTSQPAGLSCGIDGMDCSEGYTVGTDVLVTAIPADGFIFAGWSGACSGLGNVCLISMTAAQNVTAIFEAADVNTHFLTVNTTGTGSGVVTSQPAGIHCGTDCSEEYSTGAYVMITATPFNGSTFAGWSGACSGLGSVCLISMTAAQSVRATFNDGNPATTLITHYYTSILGRNPDPPGLAYWQGLILQRQTAGQDVKPVFRDMADSFFNSQEYLAKNTTAVQFITSLYLTFFQRSPEATGMNFWLGQLAGGMSRQNVMAGFLYSLEFTMFMEELGF